MSPISKKIPKLADFAFHRCINVAVWHITPMQMTPVDGIKNIEAEVTNFCVSKHSLLSSIMVRTKNGSRMTVITGSIFLLSYRTTFPNNQEYSVQKSRSSWAPERSGNGSTLTTSRTMSSARSMGYVVIGIVVCFLMRDLELINHGSGRALL